MIVDSIVTLLPAVPKYYEDRQQLKLGTDRSECAGGGGGREGYGGEGELGRGEGRVGLGGCWMVLVHTTCQYSYVLLTTEDKALRDDATLGSLGVKEDTSLYFKDLGPQISWRMVSWPCFTLTPHSHTNSSHSLLVVTLTLHTPSSQSHSSHSLLTVTLFTLTPHSYTNSSRSLLTVTLTLHTHSSQSHSSHSLLTVTLNSSHSLLTVTFTLFSFPLFCVNSSNRSVPLLQSVHQYVSVHLCVCVRRCSWLSTQAL